MIGSLRFSDAKHSEFGESYRTSHTSAKHFKLYDHRRICAIQFRETLHIFAGMLRLFCREIWYDLLANTITVKVNGNLH